LKDSHAFHRRIVGPAVRRDRYHANMDDAKLFLQKGDFLLGSVKFRLQSDSGIGAIGRPSTAIGKNQLCQ